MKFSDFISAIGKTLGTVWVDITGWLRHDGGRLAARKVAGFGILLLFFFLALDVLREPVQMSVKISNILALWPLLISGAGLIGLTVGPLA